MNTPDELKYTKDHEWVRLEGNSKATVGITDYAQEKLGNVVYIEVPEPGDDVIKGDKCATVESTKAVSDVYAPLAGTVMAVNEELADKPELINEQPYGDGWLFTMTLADKAAMEDLMDVAKYKVFVESKG